MELSKKKIVKWFQYQFPNDWLNVLRTIAEHIDKVHSSRKINTLQFVGPMDSGKTMFFSSLATFCLLSTNPRNFSTQFGKACMVYARLIHCDEAKDILNDIQEAKLMCGGHTSEVMIISVYIFFYI